MRRCLPGVTRAAVLALAPHHGLKPVERTVEVPEIGVADEVFLTSTAGGIMPLVEIDGRPVGDGKPECIVSGGAGTMAVSYMGKTYYVCCSGCRSEFNESPAKYVKEYEEKKAKKK